MKIILTGASGFLGSAIRQGLGGEHTILGLGRDKSNELEYDLAAEVPELPFADMVIHAAGKAHLVPKTEAEAAEFFNVNVKGTENLLEALKEKIPASLVFISTVAVYGLEEGKDITETTALKGNSPYALSKIQAEALLRQWCAEKGVKLVILRLPLIVGGKKIPGNLGSMVRAIKRGYYFRIGKGEARRSMVMADDIVQALPGMYGKTGIYNLTDGQHPTFADLDTYIAGQLNKKVRVIPDFVAGTVAKIGNLIPGFPLNTYRLNKLTSSLTFNDDKAKRELGWFPKPVIGSLIIE